jgi:hypothetical protein
MKNHLSTLSVLHYVYGVLLCLIGVLLLGLVFLGHYLNSDWMAAKGGEAPPFVGHFLAALGWVLFVFVELHGILNLISAGSIGRRRNRTFSQVVAALNCLNIPFGMALGVFTFVALADKEVRAEYGLPV